MPYGLNEARLRELSRPNGVDDGRSERVRAGWWPAWQRQVELTWWTLYGWMLFSSRERMDEMNVNAVKLLGRKRQFKHRNVERQILFSCSFFFSFLFLFFLEISCLKNLKISQLLSWLMNDRPARTQSSSLHLSLKTRLLKTSWSNLYFSPKTKMRPFWPISSNHKSKKDHERLLYFRFYSRFCTDISWVSQRRFL